MSNLDEEKVRRILFEGMDLDLMKKFAKILKDKQVFEAIDEEEDDRETQRMKTNTRYLAIINEARKIVPLADIFNDYSTYFAFLCHPYLYNDAITTKYTVNI